MARAMRCQLKVLKSKKGGYKVKPRLGRSKTAKCMLSKVTMKRLEKRHGGLADAKAHVMFMHKRRSASFAERMAKAKEAKRIARMRRAYA